jgi:hypothetical protein
MAKPIPSKNKSPTGWWVVTIIERFEDEGEDKSNPRRRCRAWSNIVVLKARDRNQAYNKAMKYGKLGKNGYDMVDTVTRRKARLVFEGIASLLPLYDPFDEDGTEILFEDHENVTVGRVKRWVRQKKDLEVFDSDNV